jgi:hypothetical protein
MSMEELKVKRQNYLLEEERKEREKSLLTRNQLEARILQIENVVRKRYEDAYIQTGSFLSAIGNRYASGFINDTDFEILKNSYPNIIFSRIEYESENTISFSFKPEHFFK